MLQIGDEAIDFTLKDTNGNKIRLSDFKGKSIVLYFYPKDMTPGCTKEACSFRDNFYKFKGMEIFGVSLDDEKSHKKFSGKYDLPFKLLSDVNGEVAKKYGVYRKKLMFLKSFFGIKRTTFLIDENFKIKHIFKTVDTADHANQVLEKVK